MYIGQKLGLSTGRGKIFANEATDKGLISKIYKQLSNKKTTQSKNDRDQRADSRSKKNYNPAACGTKTTFTER